MPWGLIQRQTSLSSTRQTTPSTSAWGNPAARSISASHQVSIPPDRPVIWCEPSPSWLLFARVTIVLCQSLHTCLQAALHFRSDITNFVGLIKLTGQSCNWMQNNSSALSSCLHHSRSLIRVAHCRLSASLVGSGDSACQAGQIWSMGPVVIHPRVSEEPQPTPVMLLQAQPSRLSYASWRPAIPAGSGRWSCRAGRTWSTRLCTGGTTSSSCCGTPSGPTPSCLWRLSQTPRRPL